jgi:hypothetical protein
MPAGRDQGERWVPGLEPEVAVIAGLAVIAGQRASRRLDEAEATTGRSLP